MKTIELLNTYLNCFFTWHHPEQLPALLTEDIHCYGFAGDRVVENLAQGKEMLTSGDYLQFMDYQLNITKEEQIMEDSAVIEYSLTHKAVCLRYRLVGNSRGEGDSKKLCLLNFSMLDPARTATLIEDVMREKTKAEKRQTDLQQENTILEYATAFANVWVITYDTVRGICYPDKRLRSFFGFPKKVTGFPESISAYNLILPQYIDRYCSAFHRLAQGQEEIDFDLQTYYPDGSIHWIRFRGQQLPNSMENGVNATISAQEIDKEKAMEARMQMEEKQQADEKNLLAHFITNLTKNRPVQHIYHFPERRELLEWNSIEEQSLRTEQYIVKIDKKNEFHRIHDTELLLAQYAKGRTEEMLEYRREFPDGNSTWVRSVIHLVQDPKTGDIYNYEYLYNIHEQKTSEELLTAVVEFGFERCASLMLDSDQVTILHSHKEKGKPRFEVVGYTMANRAYAERCILSDDRAFYLDACSLDKIRKRLETEESFEILHRTLENGAIHYKKDQCYRYAGEENICLLIRSDVTAVVVQEQKKNRELKKALEAANAATRAKSEFLSRMSHEIRTPMNAIMGMTAIAQENRSDFLQVSDCLNKIDQSSHFLLTLLNDILEMSRIESGKTVINSTEFDFSELQEGIRTIVETLARKSNVRYECINNVDRDYLYEGDNVRIQQILVNIITNAVKFTRPGGKVRFTAIAEAGEGKKAFLCFTVADTGIGMSEEFMQRMFKPFTQEDGSNTSRYQGSGLGLAISKNLLDLMGGSIEVESFLGVGTTFRIRVPVRRMKRSYLYTIGRKAESMEETEAKLKGCQVLLAEDHPMNVMIARKLLESRGVTVTVADNGRMAVDLFEASEPGFYQVILMDIRMPVMDGITAARQIRALKRADAAVIPIIAMTANALDEDRKSTKEAGMNAHLAKPFEPKQLYETVANNIIGSEAGF